MPKFEVNFYEVWVRTITVDAGSKEEAIEKANEGYGYSESFEYAHPVEDSHLVNHVKELPPTNEEIVAVFKKGLEEANLSTGITFGTPDSILSRAYDAGRNVGEEVTK